MRVKDYKFPSDTITRVVPTKFERELLAKRDGSWLGTVVFVACALIALALVGR